VRVRNLRVVADVREVTITLPSRARSIEWQPVPQPFAVNPGCFRFQECRWNLEIVLRQGLGELFVIQVAGNIVGPRRWESVSSPRETGTVGEHDWSSCGSFAVTAPFEAATLVAAATAHGKQNQQQPHYDRRLDTAVRSRILAGNGTEETIWTNELIHSGRKSEDSRPSVNHCGHGSDILEQIVAKGGCSESAAEWKGSIRWKRLRPYRFFRLEFTRRARNHA